MKDAVAKGETPAEALSSGYHFSFFNDVFTSKSVVLSSTTATHRQGPLLLRRRRSRAERQLLLLRWWWRRRRRRRVRRARERMFHRGISAREGARCQAGRHQRQDLTASAASLRARPRRLCRATAAGVNAEYHPVAHLGRIVSGDIGRPQ
jgi:hypothetical protein